MDAADYSHSAQSLYRECQLKCKYERYVHLVPRGRAKNHDLRFGGAAHEALAALYSGAPLTGPGNVADIFKAAYPLDQYPNPLPAKAQGKSAQNFLNALWKYSQTVFKEDMRNWEILEVERPQVTTELGDYNHMVVLDLIVRDREDGLIWGVDHKMTNLYINDLWSWNAPNSSQVRMYVNQIRTRFGQCGGFIINGISLKHRSKAYTPRTGPDRGIQLPAGDWYAFGRMTYNPDRNSLAIEQENVRITIDQMRHSLEHDDWSYNTSRCAAGTDRECPYYTACAAGWTWPRDEEMFLEYYRQVCDRQIDGESRCKRDAGHDGDCDEFPPQDEIRSDRAIIEPEDDQYYGSVVDD